MSKASKNVDAVARDVELALHTQDWYDSWATSAFVDRLQEVEERVAELVATHPSRAADLYETLIGGAHEAAESVDDSNGELTAFVETAFKGWVRARQAAGDAAEETIDALLAWMVDDDYGFCHRVEEVVVEVMTPAALAAFAAAARRALDELGAEDGSASLDTLGAQRWENVLREVTWRQGDVNAYVTVCDDLGWRPTDALRLVEHYEGRKSWQDALHWAERGLSLAAGGRWSDAAEYDLVEKRRYLLTRLGRGAEVLAELWTAYEAYPSEHTYDALMRQVPGKERAEWRARALAVPPSGGLGGALGLYRRAEADERIVMAVESATDEALEAISHYVLEPIAARLEPAHVTLAAKIHRALGWRIVAAGKSRYYAEALEHFKDARRCYLAAGLEHEWEAIGRRLRAEHGRKKGFLGEFERVVERPAPPPPTATERARSRWSKATSRGGSVDRRGTER